MPGLVQLNALAESWDLWRELEAYGAAVAAEQARQRKREQAKRRGKGPRR